MSNQTRILLDKNVARKILEGLEKLADGIAPDASEQVALSLFFTETLAGKRLFIVPATANVLKYFFGARSEVRIFESRVEIIVPADYWRRWARRLQDVGFTREDARVLSLGTFGTDEQASFLGVDEVLTFDKPLIALFDEKRAAIQSKLDAFKREVKSPYDEAVLPSVKIPE